MIRLLVAASLACLASTAHSQSSRLYSWTSTGPFFRTPGEACIWARHLYDDIEARTMSLGKDGFCRDSGGTGHRYIKPYASSGDGTVEAASGRQAGQGCAVQGLAGRERWSHACADLIHDALAGAALRHSVKVAPAGSYRNVITLDEPAASASPTPAFAPTRAAAQPGQRSR